MLKIGEKVLRVMYFLKVGNSQKKCSERTKRIYEREFTKLGIPFEFEKIS